MDLDDLNNIIFNLDFYINYVIELYTLQIFML